MFEGRFAAVVHFQQTESQQFFLDVEIILWFRNESLVIFSIEKHKYINVGQLDRVLDFWFDLAVVEGVLDSMQQFFMRTERLVIEEGLCLQNLQDPFWWSFVEIDKSFTGV